MKKQTQVTIVGAGLSGLSLAYRLQQAGVSCLLVEKKQLAGGVIESEAAGDFLIENGPNSAMIKAEMATLISDLELEEKVLRPKQTAKKRYIARRKPVGGFRLDPVPFKPMDLVSSQLLSAAAKLRLMAAVLPRRHKLEDESVQRFMSRHFGEEFTNTVVAAGLSGVWAADITKLSARSALPTLWQLEKEYHSLFLGLAKTLGKNKKKKKNRIGSFHGGLITLIETLSSQIDEKWMKTEITGLSKQNDKWLVETSDGRKALSDYLVLTTPAAATSRLLKDIDLELSRDIASIPHASVGVMQLSYPKQAVSEPLDGFGALLPPSEKLALMGAIFSSSIFEGRSPNDQHLLTCFSGGAHLPEAAEIEETKWQEQVIGELNQLIGSETKPKILKAKVWKDAIPNYPLGHHKLVESINRIEENNSGLLFCSNWLRGISLNDRVLESTKVTERIVESLPSRLS